MDNLETYLNNSPATITITKEEELLSNGTTKDQAMTALSLFFKNTYRRVLSFELHNDEGDSIEVRLEGAIDNEAQLRFDGSYVGHCRSAKEAYDLAESTIVNFF